MWGDLMKNVQPKIGKDGYNYFTYGYGTAWQVETDAGTVVYTIVDGFLQDEKQWYVVHVEGDRVSKYREMAIQRLQYILESSQRIELLDDGEPREMPVLKAEVEKYYDRYVKARNKRKREANGKLKDHKDYQKLVSEEKELTPKWAKAILHGSDTEIERRMEEIISKKRAIYQELGIDLSDLLPPEVCEECNNKGITSKGAICKCALQKEEAIKAYCAAERVVERKKQEKMNEDKNAKTAQ